MTVEDRRWSNSLEDPIIGLIGDIQICLEGISLETNSKFRNVNWSLDWNTLECAWLTVDLWIEEEDLVVKDDSDEDGEGLGQEDQRPKYIYYQCLSTELIQG